MIERSWICAAAVAVFQRMAGARRVSSIRTLVVSILFVGIALMFSQTIRSQTIQATFARVLERRAPLQGRMYYLPWSRRQGRAGDTDRVPTSQHFPDFTRCDQTTPEPNSVWKDVILHGGPARGFSQIMPAFGELLTSDQIDDLITYLRSFCRNNHWARGGTQFAASAGHGKSISGRRGKC